MEFICLWNYSLDGKLLWFNGYAKFMLIAKQPYY